MKIGSPAIPISPILTDTSEWQLSVKSRRDTAAQARTITYVVKAVRFINATTPKTNHVLISIPEKLEPGTITLGRDCC